MPPKLLAGVFWVFLGGTILSLIFDGQSITLLEGTSDLGNIALIRSFTFQLGSGDDGAGGLLGAIPIIGGFLDNIININFSFEIPYPPSTSGALSCARSCSGIMSTWRAP